MIAGTVLGIDSCIAKKADVDDSMKAVADAMNKISERMDIGSSNDEIIFQEQTVIRWENQAEYEKRNDPPTETELKIIDQEKSRLEKLRQQRKEKIDRYEGGK